MEQYREILEKVARQELQLVIFWSVVLIAVIGVIWTCRCLTGRKLKTLECRTDKKRQSTNKMLQQSLWAAVALTGICLVLGTVLWSSALKVRRDIRTDLECASFDTYSGVYYIQDHSSLSKNRLYDRWTTVDFEQGDYAHLYINSPLEWIQTDYGTFEGTVVYGRNSLIVVELHE